MQAITTTYHGPTNFRGSRIKAEAQAGKLWMPYDHALSLDGNHKAAARLLADKFNWLSERGVPHSRLFYGTDKDGRGCHIIVPVDPETLADYESSGWI